MHKITGAQVAFLSMIFVALLALLWQPAGASWPDPLRAEDAPPTGAYLAGGLQASRYLPTGQAEISRDAVYGEEEQEPHLWSSEKIRRVPRLKVQPPTGVAKSPERPAGTCMVGSAADSGSATLRECLEKAVDGDEILFNDTVFPPGNSQTITLTSQLPWIFFLDNLTIDASEAGVILDGSAIITDTSGVMIALSQGVTLRGLQIRNFDVGVTLWGSSDCTLGGDRSVGSGPLGEGNLISANKTAGVLLVGSQGVVTSHNAIIGNFIGTDISGDLADGNGYAGVLISAGATQNTIGGAHGSGDCDGSCNLISGNPVGVQIQDAGTEGNQVLGNFIGTNLAGDNANGNEIVGIVIGFGASQNVIGGAHSPGVCDGPCNLISGNIEIGGVVVQNAGTSGNQVLGNFIGTNASGDAALSNNHGVIIGLEASDTQIGGDGMGEGNLISGNTNIGLWISAVGTTGNQALGNFIGMDISGAAPVSNYQGVLISESAGNQIGAARAGAGNLISGNEYTGIWLEYLSAPGNTVVGNQIGTDYSGTQAMPNIIGIAMIEAANNVIGGAESGAGNLISGNTKTGVHIESNSTLNTVLGNIIGADTAGEAAVPNTMWGVFIGFGGSDNTIGGDDPGAGNLISGNGLAGVHIQNETSVGNRVLGNRIGTNGAGTSSLPNANGVVVILARETIIGGAEMTTPWVCDGSCNLISGNDLTGVGIQGVSAAALQGTSPDRSDRPLAIGQDNRVLGNFIGTDLSGNSALPNAAGVDVSYSATGNLIGGSSNLGEGNLISGNQRLGVIFSMAQTSYNQVSGNRIGTTADGESALPNGEYGLWIYAGAWGNIVGGDMDGYGNLISGQALDMGYYGVVIGGETGPEVRDNQVIGNLIGTNGSGTTAIPNGGGVAVAWGATGTVIRDNGISGNSVNGILFQGVSENEVRDNNIGVAIDGSSPLANGGVGIILVAAPDNTLGVGNIIAHNAVGIGIGYPESVGNTITQNSIYANTYEQIDFFEVPQPLAPAPLLTGWDGETVMGTACAGCQVEVFANANPQPAGHTYLDTTTAAGDGAFSLTIGPGERYLSATATDAEGTTSEFSNSLPAGVTLYVYLPLTVNSAD